MNLMLPALNTIWDLIHDTGARSGGGDQLLLSAKNTSIDCRYRNWRYWGLPTPFDPEAGGRNPG
jgi:hypothetical protein